LNPCSPKEDEGSGERRKKRKMHKEEEREVRVGWLASAHDVLVFFSSSHCSNCWIFLSALLRRLRTTTRLTTTYDGLRLDNDMTSTTYDSRL
jgi:hypothetical protein